MATKTGEMTFEQKCKKLDEIVKKLENTEIGLEEGTKLFEEGVGLAKDCYKMLEVSRGKIETVKKQLDKLTVDN